MSCRPNTRSTREWIQEVRLEDTDRDGALDLVLDFGVGMPGLRRQGDGSVEELQPHTKVFSMGRSGFTEISRP